MTPRAKQSTSLALVLALSGTRAVFTACMALCLSGVPAASHVDGTAVRPAAHASASAPAVSSGHAHHAAPALHVATASADERSSSPQLSAARLNPACDSCCLDGQVALVASAGGERAHGNAFGVAAIAPRVASFLLTTASFGTPPPRPLVPPPSPITAPHPLRI